MTAHAQKACSSLRLSSHGLPVSGLRTQTLSAAAVGRSFRVRVFPAAMNCFPGDVCCPASSSCCDSRRHRSTASTKTGSTGSRSRVRLSMRALRRRTNFFRTRSSWLIGHGATHRPHWIGSSMAPFGQVEVERSHRG